MPRQGTLKAMAEEDDRMVSTRATESGGPEGGDPRDDWLAGDAADLDWFPGDEAEGAVASGSRTAQGAGGRNAGPRAGSPALEDLNEFLRRRGALIVLIAAV